MSLSEQDISGSTVPKSSKQYWGPRIWRMFHLLSEVSDRTDISLLWKNWIKQTALIMPCEKCRIHLDQYLRRNPCIKQHTPLSMKGHEMKLYVRNELMQLHNAVNAQLGKHVFSYEEYVHVYMQDSTRESILHEVHRVMNELEHAFAPLEYIQANMHAYKCWKRTYTKLVSLATVGS